MAALNGNAVVMKAVVTLFGSAILFLCGMLVNAPSNDVIVGLKDRLTRLEDVANNNSQNLSARTQALADIDRRLGRIEDKIDALALSRAP